jgi:hypothetical protein
MSFGLGKKNKELRSNAVYVRAELLKNKKKGTAIFGSKQIIDHAERFNSSKRQGSFTLPQSSLFDPVLQKAHAMKMNDIKEFLVTRGGFQRSTLNKMCKESDDVNEVTLVTSLIDFWSAHPESVPV